MFFLRLGLIIAIGQAKPAMKPEIGFKTLYVDPLSDFKPKARLRPRITGGDEAKPHSIPSMAFLRIQTQNESYYCGGSLISSRCVLTAAHCIEGAVHAIVTLGAHNIDVYESTQRHIESTEFRIHPEWGLTNENLNDIGIILFPKDVAYTSAIKCVSLPGFLDILGGIPQDGDWGESAGWGYTDAAKQNLQSKLRHASLEVINNTICRKAYGDRIKSTSLCTAGTYNRGTCKGDSGGPLIVDGCLVGVTSYGLKGCPAGSISVFSRVTSYLNFIYQYCDDCESLL